MDPMAWAGDLGIDPKHLQLDHMTQPEQPQQLISHCDTFEDGDPSLRYISFGELHSNVVGLAGPNAGIQAQNFDTSGFTGPPIYESHERANENFVSAKRIELCASGEPNAYQSTSYGGMQTSESIAWFSPAGVPSSDVDMNTFNQPSGSMPWQLSIQGSFVNMPSTTDDLAAAKATPKKPKPVAKRPQNPTSRNRKNRVRLSSQRSSSPVHNKHAQAKGSQTQSNTSSQIDLTTHPKVDPQEAIALFEASIQPFSKFSQLKAADLINQLRQVVLEEQKYGRGSQSSTSDIVTTATAPSTQDSISNAELIDSECLTDNTSISSTPRQPPKDGEDTDDSMSTGKIQTDVKHEPCKHCGVKALFQCTSKNCGYSTHSFADYKRHESGEKHWPQERFMCLECVDHSFSAMNSCTFCRTPFSALGTDIPPQYVQSRVQCRAARRETTTFSRKDHLITHLRKDHSMLNMNDIIDTWKFGIESNWPRQCGFCGITFRTWNERMNHLKREFEAGKDMSKWKLPFSKLMDFRPSGPTLPKDDDDDDQDDSFGGTGSSWAQAAGKAYSQSRTQSQSNTSRSNVRQMSSSHQRRRPADAFMTFTSAGDGDPISNATGKTSITLQRYLNDTEEGIPARVNLGKSEASSIALLSWIEEVLSSSESPQTSSDTYSVPSDSFRCGDRLREYIGKLHKGERDEIDVPLHDTDDRQSILRSTSAPAKVDSSLHSTHLKPDSGLIRRMSSIGMILMKLFPKANRSRTSCSGDSCAVDSCLSKSTKHTVLVGPVKDSVNGGRLDGALEAHHAKGKLSPEQVNSTTVKRENTGSLLRATGMLLPQELDGEACCNELPAHEARGMEVGYSTSQITTFGTSSYRTSETDWNRYEAGHSRSKDNTESGLVPHCEASVPHVFACQTLECVKQGRTFGRKVDLERHEKALHEPISGLTLCLWSYELFPGCIADGYPRKDHLRDHFREYLEEEVDCARKSEPGMGHGEGIEDRRKILDKRDDPLRYRRCLNCSIRLKVDDVAWECPKCSATGDPGHTENWQRLDSYDESQQSLMDEKDTSVSESTEGTLSQSTICGIQYSYQHLNHSHCRDVAQAALTTATDSGQTPSGISRFLSTSVSDYQPRIRRHRRLTPETKERLAMIRQLGSCTLCRDRKVPCRIEHHDLSNSSNYDKEPSLSRRVFQATVQDDNETLFSELLSAGIRRSRPSIPSVVSPIISTGNKPRVYQSQNENVQSPGIIDDVADTCISYGVNSSLAPSWDLRAKMDHVYKAFISRAPFAENGSSKTAIPSSILSGIAGSGKTQLALEYAYRQEDALYRRVSWVSTERIAGPDVFRVLSPNDLLQHLNIEEQKRMRRMPPILWNSSPDYHANIDSEYPLDDKDSGTMIGTALQRYLENLKSSSRSVLNDRSEPRRGLMKSFIPSCTIEPPPNRIRVLQSRALESMDESYCGRTFDNIDSQPLVNHSGGQRTNYRENNEAAKAEYISKASTGRTDKEHFTFVLCDAGGGTVDLVIRRINKLQALKISSLNLYRDNDWHKGACHFQAGSNDNIDNFKIRIQHDLHPYCADSLQSRHQDTVTLFGTVADGSWILRPQLDTLDMRYLPCGHWRPPTTQNKSKNRNIHISDFAILLLDQLGILSPRKRL